MILADTTIVESDLVYLDVDRGRLATNRGISGPPTLVVEVLSPSTSPVDRGAKMQLYARYGVPYYWIADGDARCIEAYELAAEGYLLSARGPVTQRCLYRRSRTSSSRLTRSGRCKVPAVPLFLARKRQGVRSMNQATAANVRHLMIVSRDRPDLYEQFAERFAADVSVAVVLDRRTRERRHDDVPHLGDRPGGDRRTPGMVGDAALWLPGYMVVRAGQHPAAR